MSRSDLTPEEVASVLVRFSRTVSEARMTREILEVLADHFVEHHMCDALAAFQVDEREHAVLVVERDCPNVPPDLQVESDELGELAARVVAGRSFDEVRTLPLIAGGDLFGLVVLLGAASSPANRQLAEALIDLAAVAVGKVVQLDELVQSQRCLEASHEALTRSEKLRAMGAMAAGVSHDLKNLLNPLALQVQLLQRRCQSDPSVLEILGRMRDSLRVGVDVVERLRSFSRKDGGERLERADLAVIAARAAEIWRPRLRQARGVELRVELQAGLVEVEPGELASALVNLLVNAADALQSRGAGVIALRSGSAREGTWVEVADDGPGMPPEVRKRVLEPFFTTKSDGTGIGLAMVYAFVQRHGGRLELESEVGTGTRIRLWFPALVDAAVSEPASTTAALAARRAGTARALTR